MLKLLEKRSVHSCNLETWEWESRALGSAKRVSVLVPRNYEFTSAEAPVLFLLHGFGASRSTWLTRTRLAEYLEEFNLLVVIPESGRRWFINDVRGFRYEDYLIGELVPFIDENYGDLIRRDSRAIGGFSMGGAASLMQALRYPDVFSVVLSHAGAFEAPQRVGDPYADLRNARDFMIPTTEAHERVWGPPGSVVRRRYDLYSLIGSATSTNGLSVYADVGLGDYPRIIEMNRKIVVELKDRGVSVEFRECHGAHDLEYLDRALPFSLKFVHDKFGRS